MNFRETVAQNTAGSVSFDQWKLKTRGAVICRGSFSELVTALSLKGSLPVPIEEPPQSSAGKIFHNLASPLLP